jgi:hypothetical protein
MKPLLGLALILMGTSTFALATTANVPEIDGSSAVAAIALVSGGLLVIRGRRKR